MPSRRSKARQQQHLESAISTTSSTPFSSAPPSDEDELPSFSSLTTTFAESPLLHSSLPMAQPTRIFVASIGNPAPYLSTLHSAGHTVLHSLALTLSYPSFQKSRAHANGLLSDSASSPYTLWQSPSLMNVSGTALSAAWKQFLRENNNQGRLVVVHDELELGLGQVKVRAGSNSAKGHNGLKSIRERMGSVEYTRIGVGIGRPESREPNAVAAYVLRKMSAGEKMKIEGAAGKVLEELGRLTGN